MPALVPVTVKLILRRHGAMLILRDRVTGVGDLPGGRLEPGEVNGDWRAALRREIAEELGDSLRFALDDTPPFAFPHRILSTGQEAVGLLFQGDLAAAAEPVLSDEHDALWWRPLSEGPDPSLPPTLSAAVRAALTPPSRFAPSSSAPAAASTRPR